MEGINSLFVTNIEMPDENLPEAFLATVGAVYEDGLSLILEGQTEATTKHYKCNTSISFKAGDRVNFEVDTMARYAARLAEFN